MKIDDYRAERCPEQAVQIAGRDTLDWVECHRCNVFRECPSYPTKHECWARYDDAALEAYKARLDDQAVLDATADAIIEAHED